jgi:hypothetical protein
MQRPYLSHCTCRLVLVGCFLGLLLDPEDGDNMLLRKVGEFLSDYTESHSVSWHS